MIQVHCQLDLWQLFIVALELVFHQVVVVVMKKTVLNAWINSLGPVFAILILGLLNPNPSFSTESGDASLLFDFAIIGLAIIAFAIFFTIFQIFAFKFSKNRVIRVFIGFILTYIGLVIFLAGANLGFLPVASKLGDIIANFDNQWLLIPFGLLFGFVIVSAEPSVIVLVNQVQEVTDGRISRKLWFQHYQLCKFSDWSSNVKNCFWYKYIMILIPGYLIALVLTFLFQESYSNCFWLRSCSSGH